MKQTLPERVYETLKSGGPSYPTALAEDLGAAHGHVSGALQRLLRKGLVERVGSEPSGHYPRTIYAAVAGVDEADVRPLDRELELLRFEAAYDTGGVDAEVLACVYFNRGVNGL